MSEGRKDDSGKLRWDLVPMDALNEIVDVLTFGASKYKDRNWEKGMDWGRPLGALHRHVTAWQMGEDKDTETGKSHLAHAGCCILFLLAYEKRNIGKDDRAKLAKSTVTMPGLAPDGSFVTRDIG